MFPPSRVPPSEQEGDFQRPGVVFQPTVSQDLQKGVSLIVDAVRPTLGPLPRYVCVEHPLPGNLPELLDSGGTIARRIERVIGRNQDMGTMFMRHTLWKLQQRVGDGTTTAAILLQSIFNQGVAYVAAGGNAMRLRFFLEGEMAVLLDALKAQARPLQGKDSLARFAETVCHDSELARALGGIFEILGPYGRVEIRTGKRREVTHEFVQGVYWDEGVLNVGMIDDPRNGRTVIMDGAVLATDLEIQTPEDTVRLLEMALKAEMSGVLLICRSITDAALAPLLNPANRQRVNVLAVKLPGGTSDAQALNLKDIAIMTGARPVLASGGASLQTLELEDFGQARRIWAYRETFGITTGKGDPREIRHHVEELRQAYLAADELDKRNELEKRLGRLMGGAATLWIGAASQDAYEVKKELAERACRALRSALIGGVVPGGETAFLVCRATLDQRLADSQEEEQRAALRILRRALEEPFRTLLWNAGIQSGQAGAILEQVKPGQCYDVLGAKIVPAFELGLVDSLLVTQAALHSAISSAALLLTTDVLVHLKNPPIQYNT